MQKPPNIFSVAYFCSHTHSGQRKTEICVAPWAEASRYRSPKDRVSILAAPLPRLRGFGDAPSTDEAAELASRTFFAALSLTPDFFRTSSSLSGSRSAMLISLSLWIDLQILFIYNTRLGISQISLTVPDHLVSKCAILRFTVTVSVHTLRHRY